MKKSNIKDFEDIRQRAAAVRGHWTISERSRRTGLPPDAPIKLRDFILGGRTDKWVLDPAIAAR
jgi:hypothetical protein